MLQLKPAGILSSLADNAPTAQLGTGAQDALIALSIPAKLRRAGKETRLAIGNGASDGPDMRLVALLRDAFSTREALLSGHDDSIDAMASRLGVSRSQLSLLFRLSYLSPPIIRAIQNGQQQADLTATRLMSIAKDLPHDWQQQWRDLGFATA